MIESTELRIVIELKRKKNDYVIKYVTLEEECFKYEEHMDSLFLLSIDC